MILILFNYVFFCFVLFASLIWIDGDHWQFFFDHQTSALVTVIDDGHIMMVVVWKIHSRHTGNHVLSRTKILISLAYSFSHHKHAY